MSLRWKSSFSCNIREIDAQHKKLFEISAKLSILEPVSSKIDFEDEMHEILEDIKHYVAQHFSYEEDLLYRYGYSAYEIHKKEHQKFIDRIQEIECDETIYTNPEKIRMLIGFINYWISDHTLNVDMKYKSFLNSKGVY